MKSKPTLKALNRVMLQEVPAYGNKFFYSLGFLSMTSFVILLVTGIIMSFYGPDWWLTDPTGRYLRSVHLWATQAFVLFIILHLLVVFFTSGFKKPRRLTWVIGVVMFMFVLAEAEFGYVLRGDYSGQWRALQGADFYNGTGLGYWLHNINLHQVYGVHIAVIPFALLLLMGLHYLRIKVFGIAKPYRKDVHAATVKANHKVLYLRGVVLAGVIALLAAVFPSPYIKPETAKSIAQSDSKIVAQTLMAEFDHSSDTAGYLDSINPYNYDSREVFINEPYAKLVALRSQPDLLKQYYAQSDSVQAAQLKEAQDYFENTYPAAANLKNPLEGTIITLTQMASAGLYDPALNAANNGGDQTSYDLRFLADTGVLEEKAGNLGITTPQYGMLHEEKGAIPPGAWWLAPIGLLNHTVLANDDNGDRDGAIILGLFMMLLVAIPFVPIVNRIPDWLKVWKLIWR